MLPSNMNLNIKSGTARYKYKILVSDSGFSLGKNEMVNSLEFPVTHLMSHKNLLQKQAINHKQSTITHEEEKAALILVITGGLTKWFMFR